MFRAKTAYLCNLTPFQMVRADQKASHVTIRLSSAQDADTVLCALAPLLF
jgi:hypothetical protein